MSGRVSIGSILVCVALAAGCASNPEEDPMVVKMNDLDRRLERIERVLANQSLLDLAQQIQAVQRDMRSLRGELEELQHGSTGVKDQQRGLYADLDRRLQLLESGMAAAAVGAVDATGALPVPAGSDRMN